MRGRCVSIVTVIIKVTQGITPSVDGYPSSTDSVGPPDTGSPKMRYEFLGYFIPLSKTRCRREISIQLNSYKNRRHARRFLYLTPSRIWTFIHKFGASARRRKDEQKQTFLFESEAPTGPPQNKRFVGSYSLFSILYPRERMNLIVANAVARSYSFSISGRSL